MRRPHLIILLTLTTVPTAFAADEDALAAKKAVDAAINNVDGWVNQAQQLEGKLKKVQDTFDEARKTQTDLSNAIHDNSLLSLQKAVKRWNPGWAGHIDTLDKAQNLLLQIDPASGAKVQNLNDALLGLAARAKDMNQSVLDRWDASGAPAYIGEALNGQHRLGKAIGLARGLKGKWSRIADAKAKYDAAYKDVVTLFNPEAQNATAGLEAIQRILDRFKDRAPPPMNKILGAYADSVGGFVNALNRLETNINQNARQMVLIGSMQKDKDGAITAIIKADPSLEPLDLREMKTPAYLTGRFFVTNSSCYLFSKGRVWVFRGNLQKVDEVAGWFQAVFKEVPVGRLSAWVKTYDERIPEERATCVRFFRAFRLSLALHEDYLHQLHPDNQELVKDARAKIQTLKRMPYNTFLAHWLLDKESKDTIQFYGSRFRQYLLVQVSVTGSGDEFKHENVRVVAGTGRGGRWKTSLKADGKRFFQGLVNIDPGHTKTVYITALHGAAVAEETIKVPITPAKTAVTVHLVVEPETEEPPAPPEPDPDQLIQDNQNGPDDTADEPEPPVVTTGAGEGNGGEDEGEGGEEPENLKDVAETSEQDTAEQPQANETESELGNRPDDIRNHPRFPDFVIEVVAGDTDRAAEILAEMLDRKPDDPAVQEHINDIAPDGQAVRESNENNADLDDAFDGPAAPTDDQALADEQLNPDDLDGPIDADRIQDEPNADDTRPPKDDANNAAAANALDAGRRAQADTVNGIVQGQRRAAAAEAQAARQQIQDHKIPTRGGLSGIDAGRATSVTISVWDAHAVDGDRVDIYVGGRAVARNVSLVKAPQSFTVQLTGTFTPVKIIALNTGKSGKNTAAVAVTSGGQRLAQTSWDLPTMGIGSTLIRRNP